MTGIPYIARRRARIARTRAGVGAARRGSRTRRSIVARADGRGRASTASSWATSPCSGAAPRRRAAGRSTCTACPTSSDDWVAFLERTGGRRAGPARLRAQRQARRPATSRCAGFDRFLEAFLDHAEARARAPRRPRLGRRRAAVGAARARARRAARRDRRRAAAARLPLAPGGAAVADARRRRARRWACDAAYGRRRALPAPPCADASWPHFDQGTQRAILNLYRASPEDALARAGLDLAADRCPALVVWGDRDPCLPARFADAYAGGARRRRGERRTLPDAGHWPWLGRPDVVDRVAAFLDA